MFKTRTIDWRQHYPQLAAITDPAWIKAIEHFEPVTVPGGTQAYIAGDECRNFLLLLKGNIRVYASGRGGREIVLYRIQPGEFCILSLVSFLQGSTFPANAVTENQVQALVMDRNVFKRTMKDSPALCDIMMMELSNRFIEIINRVQELAFEPLDLRMSSLLCRRFREEGGATIDITHSQLAQELGTTREVASRMLKDLERGNYIILSRGRVSLHDNEAIGRMYQLGER
ncbi:MAG: Crp/Fnr family transcriptional regulator [Pseudomonadota bacterium]